MQARSSYRCFFSVNAASSDGCAFRKLHVGKFWLLSMHITEHLFGRRVKYLYDGSCKVCQTFKSSLQSQEGNKDRINYINIVDDSFDPSDHNDVSYDDAMSTIHAITPEGRTLKGKGLSLLTAIRSLLMMAEGVL